MSVQIKPKNSPAYHQIQIQSNLHGQQRNIVAFCQDQFAIGYQNVWRAPMTGIDNMVGEVGSMLSTTGKTLTSQVMTALSWKSSSIPSVALNLSFVAQDDETVDVLQPLADLFAIAVPKLSSASQFLLELPGPSSAQYALYALKKLASGDGRVHDGDENATTDYIRLRIGNILRMPSVVVGQITMKPYTHVSSINNLPVLADVDVTFHPFVTPYLDDINYMFNLQNLGAGAGAAG